MSNDSANIAAPSVQTSVDPNTARLGDLVTLNIHVTHPPALIMGTPAFSKTLGEFEIYSSTQLPHETQGDLWVDHFQATLQGFTTGPLTLPSVEVPYRDPMGKTFSVKTSTLTVTLQEVPAGPKDKEDIRGIKGVLGPTAWSPWWWVVGLFLLSALCYLLWRKRKLAQAGPPPPPPIPADVLALEKLQRLARTDWLNAGKTKEYYSAISDILREYLENGFKIFALERTTSELMRDMRKKAEFSTERQSDLKEILEMCDLVKFAKFRPEISEATTLCEAAVTFVNNTKPTLSEDA